MARVRVGGEVDSRGVCICICICIIFIFFRDKGFFYICMTSHICPTLQIIFSGMSYSTPFIWLYNETHITSSSVTAVFVALFVWANQPRSLILMYPLLTIGRRHEMNNLVSPAIIRHLFSCLVCIVYNNTVLYSLQIMSSSPTILQNLYGV
jgi:hypothetical protein